MPFEKLLIANRGEIALRIIRACRALGISAVAVYSAADRGAPHVRVADEAFLIETAPSPGAVPPSPYLDARQIIAVARRAGAQAIHPGYGFLSERAHFARACREAGLVFVGPPAEVIELMGTKTAAKRLAESAGVPTVPGYTGDDQHPEVMRAEAERIGPPLLVKASAGGGGRGMRAVHDLVTFDESLESARREAQAAFGDGALFLEKLVERPRHVEVQVLADAHGSLVHLFERECSIQRRHQKIVEESPSPALSPEQRAAICADAVRLARAAGYVNAGTVEFLLDQDGRHYFLEMNTRLQVEHPVTEAVTGLDLVQLQLAVAAGAPLPFGQEDLTQRGHAIEVRVCAEDPATFLPTSGRLALFEPPSGSGIRSDAGVTSGDELSVHYDPMFAKLIVHASNRAAAVSLLRHALDDYVALGVTTNLPLLRAIAAHPAFASGNLHTAFLEETNLPAALESPGRTPTTAVIAAALYESLERQAAGPPQDPWDRYGWQPHGRAAAARYTSGGDEHPLRLREETGAWQVSAADGAYHARVMAFEPHALTLALAAPSPEPSERVERFRVARDGADLLVHWRGDAHRVTPPAPPSLDAARASGGAGSHAGLAAPMPGTVIKVHVEVGQQVAAHQPLLVLEAMKMEHTVSAPHAGVVRRLNVAPAELVAKGAVLVELDEL
jgi:3-methylcrotonyl-CoA carboxylase alpha subunit